MDQFYENIEQLQEESLVKAWKEAIEKTDH